MLYTFHYEIREADRGDVQLSGTRARTLALGAGHWSMNMGLRYIYTLYCL